MVLSLAPPWISTPAAALGRAAVPATLVPMRFPSIVLPKVGPKPKVGEIRMPAPTAPFSGEVPVVPEIRLPVPGAVPPIRVPLTPLSR